MTEQPRSSARSIRVITRLDIKAPYLIKGVNLEGVRKIGLPNEFANRYAEAASAALRTRATEMRARFECPAPRAATRERSTNRVRMARRRMAEMTNRTSEWRTDVKII